MFRVEMTQHPVGQGSMMSGILSDGASNFVWVYDCGSNQKEPLIREIKKIKYNKKVDRLFISHLDSDHVNGIDYLLTSVAVEEVVLPYLNDIDLLLVLARDIENGVLTGSAMSMLSDIETWFRGRGVQRITMVNPTNDEGEGPLLAETPEFPSGTETPSGWQAVWSGTPEPAGVDFEIPSRVTRIVAPNSTLQMRLNGQDADWVFIPFAHQPAASEINKFISEIKRNFNINKIDRKFLKEAIKDIDGREKLKYCYSEIWKEHNLVSMALFAGLKNNDKYVNRCFHSCCRRHYEFGRCCRCAGCCYGHCAAEQVSWLSTGDMKLKDNNRRTAFTKHYKDVVNTVGTFTLPHHGAEKSFHQDILDFAPNVMRWVASSGPNGYGHPSNQVKNLIEGTGKHFFHVSECQCTIVKVGVCRCRN